MEQIAEVARGSLERLRRMAARAAQRWTAWWREHRNRMTDDSGYAEMLIELTLTAVDLPVASLRVRYLVRAITSA